MTKTVLDLTEAQRMYFKRIRMIATSRQPYVAEAILRLIPVSTPDIKTMAVDKFWRLYIDFDYIMNKGYEYGAGILAHEVWHVLRKHEQRSEDMNISSTDLQDIWNIAGDLEINDDIENLIPVEAFVPGKGSFSFLEKGKTAEEYYYSIINKITEAQGLGKPNSNEGSNEPNIMNGDNEVSTPDISSDAIEGNTEPVEQTPSFDMSKILDALEEKSKCGSGAGNNNLQEIELEEQEAPKVSPYEAEVLKKKTARNIKEAFEQSELSQEGQALSIWAEEVLAHKPINWRTILQNTLKTAVYHTTGQKDYVKTVPNRRQPIPNVIMPAMKSPKPRVAVGIDTSASNLIKLGIVIEEVMAITKRTGIRGRDLLTFNVDDSVVENATRFITNKKDLHFSGAGGTNLNKAFDFVSKSLHKKIDIFILLTDGEYDNWYETKPKYCGNITFITVLMVDSNNKELTEEVISIAKEKLSSWNHIVVVDIANETIPEQHNQNLPKKVKPIEETTAYEYRPQDFTWTYKNKNNEPKPTKEQSITKIEKQSE